MDNIQVTKEEYKDLLEETKDKDLSALDDAVRDTISNIISRARQMRKDGKEISDPLLNALINRLSIVVMNRNNLEHFLESIAWYEEYIRNR